MLPSTRHHVASAPCRRSLVDGAVKSAGWSAIRYHHCGAANGPMRRASVVTQSGPDSYAKAYEQIRATRAAKYGTKEERSEKRAEKKRKEEAGEEETEMEEVYVNYDMAVQLGDTVTVAWECKDPETEEILDSSFAQENNTRYISFQVGTDAGFEPKRGMKLAFSKVADTLKVGERASVIVKPSGSGWFKSYAAYSTKNVLLSELTNSEKKLEWAKRNVEVVFTIQVTQIVPPRGRER